MQLTFFGSSLSASRPDAAATHLRGLFRALHERGHVITFCQPDLPRGGMGPELPGEIADARIVTCTSAADRDEQLAVAFAQSDWVVKCSGVGLWDEELERGMVGREGAGALTAFWDVDVPATLTSIAADPEHHLARSLSRFDRIFTHGGGPPVVERYLRLGARSCTPIYNALEPREWGEAGRPREKRWDLLFVGNRLADREARVEEFFLRSAQLVPGARFALAGEGWDDKALPGNVEYLGFVAATRHAEVYGAARLVLNIQRATLAESGWFPSVRLFEAAGAAACQVTDCWRGIGDFFVPWKEILVATDADDVARFVREVDAQGAEAIGEAARRRALTQHTYAHRAEQIEAVLRTPTAAQA
jgi:spore maturation protein CgeB